MKLSSTPLHTWLSRTDKLAGHLSKVAVCSFVRFSGRSIDLERDERRNFDVLGELLARELPGEAQVEMARLVSAKTFKWKSRSGGPLDDSHMHCNRRAAHPFCRPSGPYRPNLRWSQELCRSAAASWVYGLPRNFSDLGTKHRGRNGLSGGCARGFKVLPGVG
jgi:hypothetical protein